MKTVLDKEKTAAVKKTLKKTFKREKTDINKKKKKNNAVDTEKSTEAVKLVYCSKLDSKLNSNIQYNI